MKIMRLNDNMFAPALRHMKLNYANMQRAMLRLSTGKRINSAADDPSGMAISSKFRAMIRGLDASEQNIEYGISLLQVKDAALNEVHSMLQRMYELSVASANGSFTDQDRAKMDMEFQQLSQAIGSVFDNTEFNRKKLFQGCAYKSSDEISSKRDTPFKVGTTNEDYLYIQTGANAGQGFLISNNTVSAERVGIHNLDIKTAENAGKAITSIQRSIDSISVQRASIGSEQNRLERSLNALQNYRENLEAAESRISDADMAKEMMEYAKSLIRQQAIMFVMSQAKRRMYDVLILLR